MSNPANLGFPPTSTMVCMVPGGAFDMRKGLHQSPKHRFEGKIYRKAIYLRVKTVKTLVSCKQSQQSLQPIHWSNCCTLDPHLQNGSMFSFRNPYLCWNIRFLFKNSQGPGAKPQNLACRNTLGRGVTVHFHVPLALQPPNRIGKHGFWSHNSY